MQNHLNKYKVGRRKKAIEFEKFGSAASLESHKTLSLKAQTGSS